MDKDTRDILETVNFIKDYMVTNMATKEEMTAGFAGIMSELTDIKARLHVLEELVADHAGYSKEIDHAFERIAAIEQHLGLKGTLILSEHAKG